MVTIQCLLKVVGALMLMMGEVTSFSVLPRVSTISRCMMGVVSTPLGVLASEPDVSSDVIVEENDSTSDESESGRVKVERERHTVFVGNLPFDVTNQDVKELFEAYGKVELVALPKNKVTDQPRGFAFVDMSTEAELQAAIAGADGSTFNNRLIRVMKSVPPEDRENKPAPTSTKPKRTNKSEDNNSKKLYVGNIPFDATKDDLLELYEPLGKVIDVFIPQNADTGKGRGFAFVTMNDEDVQSAIDATNGVEFRGRKLTVNRPLPPGEKSSASSRAPAAPRAPSTRTKLYIGNLSFYTVADSLKEIFEEFGTVYDCYLPEDPSTGGTRGFGFVTMSRDEALNAIAELDGCEVDGRVIRVNEAKPKGAQSSSDEESE